MNIADHAEEIAEAKQAAAEEYCRLMELGIEDEFGEDTPDMVSFKAGFDAAVVYIFGMLKGEQ